METRLFVVNREKFEIAELAEPARLVAEGGLVAFPTETVYGIAANAERPEAIRRLLEVRESPDDKKLTVHIGDLRQLARHVDDVPAGARRLMKRFWPGPLTIVLPTKDGGSLGFRFPEDAVARALLSLTGVPVVAPSANTTGKPPMNDPQEILKVFGGKIDAVVDAGAPKYGKSSTVVEFGPQGFQVLREGVLPRGQVEEESRIRILFVCFGNTCRSPMAEALLRRGLALRLGVPEEKLSARGYIVESAGMSAENGASLSPNAEKVLREMGCRVRRHSSRIVTAAMLSEADRIFAMTQRQLEQVTTMVPEARDKARALDPARDVEDPIGGDIERYRSSARHIRKALEGVVKTL